MSKGVLRIGPAGWSYTDWKGVVYPPDMPRSVHALELLSEWFDTVEINSSFYRPTNPKHAESWVQKVAGNQNFRFTAKLWERFTHQRDEWPSESDARQVREGFAPLAGAGMLGAMLMQFPWSFRRTPENRHWLSRIIDTFSDYPLALEVRHASWDQPEVYEGLRERGVAFCNIDQPMFRNSIAPSQKVTAPLGYVRLHGRNYNDWFREEAGRDDRYDYLYSEEELKPWMEKIERIQETADQVYAITNNHFRGQAVVNAFEMESAAGVKRVPIPEHLMAEYPQLRKASA
jgi:uncharacterized protein YecE (DUF72 family)